MATNYGLHRLLNDVYAEEVSLKEGKAFMLFKKLDNIAADDTYTMVIKTPEADGVLKLKSLMFKADTEVNLEVYEGADISDYGSDRIPLVNQNRASERVSGIELYEEPTLNVENLDAAGNLIKIDFVGGMVNELGLYLKPDTNYLLVFTNLDAENPTTSFILGMHIFDETAYVTDKSGLMVKLADMDDLIEADYTPETWGILASAILAAEVILANPDATQGEVDEVLEDLVEAYEGLELAPVE